MKLTEYLLVTFYILLLIFCSVCHLLDIMQSGYVQINKS